ncbi:MAG: DUF211 domain-containing protein [Ketobacteraceae bacterium]|nr:DUF211 domain-containing protein [Ketobacteraceae bacterium]
MIVTKKLVLDVLKPLRPNTLEFAQQINAGLPEVEVHVKLMGVDDKTQDVMVTLTGQLDFARIETVLESLGASIHSIDEVLTSHVASASEQTD